MTCSKDCSTCVYGFPVKHYKCGDPNITCNLDCQNCSHSIVLSMKWYCDAKTAYSVKGGIAQ